jgi:hypothetical protein
MREVAPKFPIRSGPQDKGSVLNKYYGFSRMPANLAFDLLFKRKVLP